MARRRMLMLLLAATPACLFVVAAAAQDATSKVEAPAVKVGDTWRWARSDRRTGLKEAETLRVIKTVSAQRVEATENDIPVVMTPDLSMLETGDWVRTEPARFVEFPLSVGKQWSFKYVQKGKTASYRNRFQFDAEAVGQEKVKVPAGEFDTFKVVAKGYWNSETGSGGGAVRVTSWYAPAARTAVKVEVESGSTYNVSELLELRLSP